MQTINDVFDDGDHYYNFLVAPVIKIIVVTSSNDITHLVKVQSHFDRLETPYLLGPHRDNGQMTISKL